MALNVACKFLGVADIEILSNHVFGIQTINQNTVKKNLEPPGLLDIMYRYIRYSEH